MMDTAVQAYPTSVRTASLGFFSAIGRLGAMVAPFLTVVLARSQLLPLAEALLAVLALVTCLAVVALPLETGGRELEVCAPFFFSFSCGGEGTDSDR